MFTLLMQIIGNKLYSILSDQTESKIIVKVCRPTTGSATPTVH